MGQQLSDGSRICSQPGSHHSCGVFLGEAAAKGQIRLPRMGCSTQHISGAPSSSNPQQAPAPRTRFIYRVQGITTPGGHLQSVGTAGANLVPHTMSSSEQLQSPKDQPASSKWVLGRQTPPNAAVSKLGLAPGSVQRLL